MNSFFMIIKKILCYAINDETDHYKCPNLKLSIFLSFAPCMDYNLP